LALDVSRRFSNSLPRAIVTTTNNPLDLALNGGGFFRMSNGGEITYTRNGQFHIDKDGYIINDQNGGVLPETPLRERRNRFRPILVELQLSTGQIAPRCHETIWRS
jgi:flagellar hook protein FlgE